jgi:hypothetical protein
MELVITGRPLYRARQELAAALVRSSVLQVEPFRGPSSRWWQLGHLDRTLGAPGIFVSPAGCSGRPDKSTTSSSAAIGAICHWPSSSLSWKVPSCVDSSLDLSLWPVPWEGPKRFCTRSRSFAS